MTDHIDFAQRWREAQGYDATREVLRDAAHDMIRAGGLNDLSMRALAARVGASAMAAYRYYPGKEKLVEDVRDRIRHDFASCLQDAAAVTSDPVGKFRSLCSAYLDFAVRNEEDYRLLFGSVALPIVDAENDPPNAPAWLVLVRALETLPGAKSPESTIDQAHLIWATLHGLVMLHLSRRLILGRSVEQLAEPLVQFLFGALRLA
ncbi:MAG: TetR/AcrR family transcriptional regulator [Sphingobium sp.]